MAADGLARQPGVAGKLFPGANVGLGAVEMAEDGVDRVVSQRQTQRGAWGIKRGEDRGRGLGGVPRAESRPRPRALPPSAGPLRDYRLATDARGGRPARIGAEVAGTNRRPTRRWPTDAACRLLAARNGAPDHPRGRHHPASQRPVTQPAGPGLASGRHPPASSLTTPAPARQGIPSLDSVLQRVADELRLVVQLQLGQGVADMVLHRAGGQGQPAWRSAGRSGPWRSAAVSPSRDRSAAGAARPRGARPPAAGGRRRRRWPAGGTRRAPGRPGRE